MIMVFKTHSVLFTLVFLFLSCSPTPNVSSTEIQLRDGDYDFGFPPLNDDAALNHLSQSIVKIGYIAYFEVYYFAEDQLITTQTLSQSSAKELTRETDIFTESGTGTATVISSDSKYVRLLTCAHIGDFPDTIYTYYPDDPPLKTVPILYSIAVKLREKFYLPEITHDEDLIQTAFDRKSDLALYELNIRPDETLFLPQLQVEIGKAKDLKSGNFVYIIGYPIGNKMITSGMVSKPQRFNPESFLIDANFNYGLSGAPIFAIRDGIPNYEWVGIARSVSADSYWALSPDESHLEKPDGVQFPYDGPVFIEKRNTIRYGSTHTVPAESIIRFLGD